MAQKDQKWWAGTFKEELGSNYSNFDETTVDYCVSMLMDKDTNEEDLVESLCPLIQGGVEDEKKAEEIAKKLIQHARGKPEGSASSAPVDTKKVLGAPIVISKIAAEDDDTNPKAARNYNSQREVDDIDTLGLNAKELTEKFRNRKKQMKQDKKNQFIEMKLAREREEALAKLQTKMIKVHVSEENNRDKDIKLEEISMSLPNLELLENVSITFSHGHRYGLVGRNGTGKTTFLKHIASHSFAGIPKHLQIVHIEQEIPGSEKSVLETILSIDEERDSLMRETKALQAYMDRIEKNRNLDPETEQDLAHFRKDFEEFKISQKSTASRSDRLNFLYDRLNKIEADAAPARAATILRGLGFTHEDESRPTNSFSGGWRMRVSIAQALFIAPDVLLLDEPTNHLDLHSVLWLQEYLSKYDRTIIIVSHDRDFLNAVTTDIVLLKDKALHKYRGNYNAFERQREEAQKNQARAHAAQAAKIKDLEEFIAKNRVRTATAAQTQARIKQLEKIEVIEEVEEDPTFVFTLPEVDAVEGSLITLQDVSFSYPGKPELYHHVDLDLHMKSRIALVGANGAGKSTLLKLILGEIEPTKGSIKVNGKARISRFTQHHMDQLDLEKTPLEWFMSLYPDAKHHDIRKHLGQMGITGNLALRPIYSLSGGQKSRVAFAYVTYTRPHILLLDEPTNHLDMETVDALINACNKWSGSLLIVSHDEHMISTVCNTMWQCGKQTVKIFPGTFESYKMGLINDIKNTKGQIKL